MLRYRFILLTGLVAWISDGGYGTRHKPIPSIADHPFKPSRTTDKHVCSNRCLCQMCDTIPNPLVAIVTTGESFLRGKRRGYSRAEADQHDRLLARIGRNRDGYRRVYIRRARQDRVRRRRRLFAHHGRHPHEGARLSVGVTVNVPDRRHLPTVRGFEPRRAHLFCIVRVRTRKNGLLVIGQYGGQAAKIPLRQQPASLAYGDAS